MLQALSQLGKIEDKYESTSRIKHIIGLVFESGKYVESKPYEFDASEFSKYLYEKDPSGKPGLFLTGNIPVQSIKELSDHNTRSEFIRKKILWFSHGKLVKDPNLFQSLSHKRQIELKSIFKQLEDEHERISRDVINILTNNLPEQTLLTIMIGQQFVGQIQDYVDFFNKGILYKKGVQEQLVCNVCNKLRLVAPYRERSLPFFFSDKIHFFDNGNITRSFPVCDDCYQSLQNGIKFVDNRLNYNVSSTSKLIQTKRQKKKSNSAAAPNIKFWLTPFVNNPKIFVRFKNDLTKHNKQLYYLDSLKDLCNSLKLIQTYDVEERQAYFDAFLRFSALFYYKDNKAAGLMRPLNYVPDIYPPQLRKLLEVKQRIDNLYPFLHIKKYKLFVGFPLLVAFYKDITPRWQNQVIEILNKLFTGQRLPIDQMIRNIKLRIHETLGYSKDLQTISQIALSGLMLLEYITTLNNVDSNSISRSEGIMLKVSTYEIEHTEKFIENHKSLLSDETKQGVFAAGILVAMLLDFQEGKYKKTAPFWDKLSRLDLNLQKVSSLITEVKRLFGVYKNREHDTLINYLTAKYAIDPSESIPKDLVSYLFTLGLSFGYLLAREYLMDVKEEEVKI